MVSGDLHIALVGNIWLPVFKIFQEMKYLLFGRRAIYMLPEFGAEYIKKRKGQNKLTYKVMKVTSLDQLEEIFETADKFGDVEIISEEVYNKLI